MCPARNLRPVRKLRPGALRPIFGPFSGRFRPQQREGGNPGPVPSTLVPFYNPLLVSLRLGGFLGTSQPPAPAAPRCAAGRRAGPRPVRWGL